MERKLSYGFLLTAAAIPLPSYSAVYLNVDQVISEFFPGQKFVKSKIELTSSEVSKIEDITKERVREKALELWTDKAKDAVFVDTVVGKHEFITIAVAIEGKGQVKGIEILEYKETYGYQVRDESWRKQFIGKDKSAPLRVKEDVTNISGATLSTTHVAGGVRRILQTYDVIKDRI